MSDEQLKKLEKVVGWLNSKSEPAFASLDKILTRLCSNFRIDLRPDYPQSDKEATLDVVNSMLSKACRHGKRLKLLLDTVILNKGPPDPMPQFMDPAPVKLDLPEYSHLADEAKVQAVFGRLLHVFLLRLWTPLRYSEELVSHLNVYCASLRDLAKDVATAPPKDANTAAVAVLEQLKRLESNLSRIEVFVLTVHHQPAQVHVSQLVQLREELLRCAVADEEYRKRKDAILDQMVAFNKEKFRPSVFFLLSDPDKSAARASISPNIKLDKSLDQVVRDATTTATTPEPVAPGKGSPQVSIDDLMAMARAPLRTSLSKPLPPPVSSGRGSRVLGGPGSRATVAFGSGEGVAGSASKDWEKRDVLASPFQNSPAPLPSPLSTSDGSTSNQAGSRHTVAFGEQELARLNELEKLRKNNIPAPTPASPPSSKSPRLVVENLGASAGSSLLVEKLPVPPPPPEREMQSKVIDGGKKGSLSFQVFLGSLFVGQQILWVETNISNSLKGCRVDGIELLLRDPSFTKIFSQDSCVDRWTKRKGSSLPSSGSSSSSSSVLSGSGSIRSAADERTYFPLKVGQNCSLRIPIHLPFLAPSSGRSRYTLSLALFGKGFKKDAAQLSLQLAIVEKAQLYTFISSQIFGAPLEALPAREGTLLPRLWEDCKKFFAGKSDAEVVGCFEEALSTVEEERVSWLAEQYNFGGRGEDILRNGEHPRVVAHLFRNFCFAFPEPVIPSALWPELVKPDQLPKVLESLKPQTLRVLKELVGFLVALQGRKILKSIETFGPVIARPAGRTPDTLAPAELSQAMQIAASLPALVK